ncbi:hypothetical protein ACOSQ3_002747 [Xanthoceras sorbifolium]
MAANPPSLPLFEKIYSKNKTQRVADVTVLFLLFSLLVYRLLSLQDHGFPWFLAFMCESWFTLNWVIIVTIRWTPLVYKIHPELLEQRVQELPAVDMFVTTADPVLEPPIITVNTVLSLMALDYPANKLACYVSDDGCSPLNFYALVEASKLAKLWVPFCKKYNVKVRAPFKYFSDESVMSSGAHNSWQFHQDWKNMKEEYERLRRNIEDAAKKSAGFGFDLTGEFAVFSNTEPRNHPAIVKIIWENKKGHADEIPHLVYISREKQSGHPHHYKAGAMNVLTRVSGIMTNAPFMLNVDCDMFANNPQIVRHAMCLLLGSKEKDCAFVQCPQLFYNNPNIGLVVSHEYMSKGIIGIQGPFYIGSGCFHRRKVIYGPWPEDTKNDSGRYYNSVMNGKVDDDEILLKEFGNSMELIKSAAHALKGKIGFSMSPSNSLDAAHQVAGSAYEYGSSWGEKVGWIYGSTAEDILTGLMIHKRGWRSGYCNPNPPAFLGCAPSNSIVAMTQQKRWTTGLLEILFSKNNPISATLAANLQFRQCLAYLFFQFWGLRSIPELCYVALPAYCIITDSNFLSKGTGASSGGHVRDDCGSGAGTANHHYESVLSGEAHNSWQFHQDWKMMKVHNERLRRNIEEAAKKSAAFDLAGEFAVFSNTEPRNHPAVIKIPHLVYISREKQPKHPHHYKAGAMNVPTRVSGLMTNAPFMLNEKDCAFAQFPQLYYNYPNNGHVIIHENIVKGIVEIEGPFYEGSGSFHKRKVIYGLRPEDTENDRRVDNDEMLLKEFGNSKELIKSAAHALKGDTNFPKDLSNSLDVAHRVAGSTYEYGSSWGEKNTRCICICIRSSFRLVVYGSAVEDNLIGLMIHTRGWKSAYCNTDPPAFLGCAPSSSIEAMIQQKRWCTGLTEILFSKNNPISCTLAANLQFRQCLAYLFFQFWGLCSIPELCYAALPANCIITDSNFLPKSSTSDEHDNNVDENASKFIFDESAFFVLGTTVLLVQLVALSTVLLGLQSPGRQDSGLDSTEAAYEVADCDYDSGTKLGGLSYIPDLCYAALPAYCIITKSIFLRELTGLATCSLGLQPQADQCDHHHHGAGGSGVGVGELMCSVNVVSCFWPFVMGLFGPPNA